MRASTAVQRDRQLRRLIGAEVQRGVNPDDLHSLADVIQPDRLKEGLRFMHERCSNGSHVQLRDIHSLALVIASRWAELPRDRFEEIKKLGRGLKNARGGMTEKNRKRLAQFCDDGNVGQLLLLPEKLVRAARKGPAGYNASLKVQMAVAISILIFAPLRLGNLRTLDRTRHFYWDRSNGRRALHIVIPKDEVKNDVELEYPLPDEVTELIDHYIAKHQPRLANGHPSGLLFPGRTGQAKSESGLRNGLISTIRRETGLVMNPHLFRHLVGLLYLETNPGDYESVRLLLGHKSINTTIKFYTGQEIRRTVERYDKIILERQDAASRRLDKSKSKKK